MARARHAKPSGLLARLLPGRTARREAARRQQALLRQLGEELRHLREVADTHAAAAAAAEVRAREAELRAAQAQAATAQVQEEVLRLREELLWAWAAGRLPTPEAVRGSGATVIDLRDRAQTGS
jgi:hypothetical protein